MDPLDLERARLLLHQAPGRSLPLARLCAALSAEGSPPPPSLLANALAADPRFLVSGGTDPLDGIPHAWDRATRDLYRSAIGAATGEALRVTLLEPAVADDGPDAHVIALVDRSLRQLRAPEVPGMADRIAEARAEYGEIVRLLPPQAAS